MHFLLRRSGAEGTGWCQREQLVTAATFSLHATTSIGRIEVLLKIKGLPLVAERGVIVRVPAEIFAFLPIKEVKLNLCSTIYSEKPAT